MPGAPHGRRPRLTSILLLLGLAATALLLACGSDADGGPDATPEPDLRVSAHGVDVALTLPDTLPEGVSAEDVTVEVLPLEASSPVAETGADVTLAPLASVRLLPDGLAFDTPVTVDVTIPDPGHEWIVATHLSADAPGELPDVRQIAYDPDGERSTFRVTVTHFSEIYMAGAQGGSLTVRLLPPIPSDTYLVGESFAMSVQVRRERLSADWTHNGRTFHGTSRPGDDWSVESYWASGGDTPDHPFRARAFDDSSPLAPSAVPPRFGPDATAPSVPVTGGTSVYSTSQTFTCIEPGGFEVAYSARGLLPARVTEILGPNQTREFAPGHVAVWAGVRITGVCVAPAGGDPTSVTEGATPAVGLTPAATTTAAPGSGSSTLPGTPQPVPTVVVPTAPRIPTPVVPGQTLEGFLKVYAYNGVWYDGSSLVVTPAHPPFCSYEHLHGGPIQSILPGPGGQPTTISEMYGECGYGPTSALYWITDPR